MFLQPRLKDLNSKSRSTSPFPSTIMQPRTYSGLIGQDASYISRHDQSDLGSLDTYPVPSAGNSIGSWDMSLVSSRCFVCDMMLRYETWLAGRVICRLRKA
jgi:hypothetical protein